MGKDIKSFPLPDIDKTYNNTDGEAREIIEETTIEVDEVNKTLASSLNPEKNVAYNEILEAVDSIDGGVFLMVREELGKPSCIEHCSLRFEARERLGWPCRRRVSPLPSCLEAGQPTQGSKSHSTLKKGHRATSPSKVGWPSS
jgi:hypothetical protein